MADGAIVFVIVTSCKKPLAKTRLPWWLTAARQSRPLNFERTCNHRAKHNMQQINASSQLQQGASYSEAPTDASVSDQFRQLVGSVRDGSRGGGPHHDWAPDWGQTYQYGRLYPTRLHEHWHRSCGRTCESFAHHRARDRPHRTQDQAIGTGHAHRSHTKQGRVQARPQCLENGIKICWVIAHETPTCCWDHRPARTIQHAT